MFWGTFWGKCVSDGKMLILSHIVNLASSFEESILVSEEFSGLINS